MRMGLYPERRSLRSLRLQWPAWWRSARRGVCPGDRVVAGTVRRYASSDAPFRGRLAGRHELRSGLDFVNFVTALGRLDSMSRVRKSDRVLIHSAAGGVGVAAVQIAANAGAVIGLSGRRRKQTSSRSWAPPTTTESWDNERSKSEVRHRPDGHAETLKKFSRALKGASGPSTSDDDRRRRRNVFRPRESCPDSLSLLSS